MPATQNPRRHVSGVLARLGLFAALAVLSGCGGVSSDKTPGPGGSTTASLSRSVVTAFPTKILPTQVSTLTLVARDAAGAPLTGGGLTVTFGVSGGSSAGTLGAVTDHADGTYTAAFTGTAMGTPLTVSASIDGSAVTSRLPTIQVTSQPALQDTTGAIPLIDMAGYSYRGFPGLLYPDGNDCPAAHLVRQPPVSAAQPFVFLSLGMSNVKHEFCDPPNGIVGPQNCETYSFVGKASQDASLNDNMTIVNGGIGGATAVNWEDPGDQVWTVVNSSLGAFSKTAADVQVIWSKMANKDPVLSLPSPNADAHVLAGEWADIVRNVKTRFPNVKQMYLASRIYSCAAPGTLNPEPFAYESGFAVKWLIEEQIRQLNGQPADPTFGPLTLDVAPWLAWGPYLWADGNNPRSDGLTWERSDLGTDCTHPSDIGKAKVAQMLLDFLKTSPMSSPWFLD
jgi:hypothetical protein